MQLCDKICRPPFINGLDAAKHQALLMVRPPRSSPSLKSQLTFSSACLKLCASTEHQQLYFIPPFGGDPFFKTTSDSRRVLSTMPAGISECKRVPGSRPAPRYGQPPLLTARLLLAQASSWPSGLVPASAGKLTCAEIPA